MDYFKMLEKLILIDYLKDFDNAFLDLVSDFSLKPYGLILLKNELILNKRSNLLEFGSGLSTIFLAQIIKKNNLQAKITTIESGKDWISRLKRIAQKLGLNDIINIIYAPLTQNGENDRITPWYDTAILNMELDNEQSFDMIIIDGPPAFNSQIESSRYPAIPFVINLLSNNYFIFLDDAHRKGERAIIKSWNKQFGFDFQTYNQQFAVHYAGMHRISKPGIINSLLLRSMSLS